MYNGIEVEYRYPNAAPRSPKERVVCNNREEYEALIEQAENGEINIVNISNNENMGFYFNKKMRRLQESYISTKDRYHSILKKKEEIDTRILDKHIFIESERAKMLFDHRKCKRVKNPKLLYALRVEELNRFHRIASSHYKTAGLGDNYTDCYTIIENIKAQLREAENDLIEYGVEILGNDELKSNIKILCQSDIYRDKVLNLLMQLPC